MASLFIKISNLSVTTILACEPCTNLTINNNRSGISNDSQVLHKCVQEIPNKESYPVFGENVVSKVNLRPLAIFKEEKNIINEKH